jgi:3'(2'), 5'-bisphosphate nucleotidase
MTAEARLLDELTHIASRAAAAILAVPLTALAQRNKPDGSPVTAADEASDSVIQAALKELLPGVPVISEEAEEHSGSPQESCFVLVDPLDGTREFLAGRNEFTVNIALVDNGVPHLGVIAAPAHGRLWRGSVGGGAERLDLAPGEPASAARERRPIRSRPRPNNGVVAVTSRSHFDAATAAWLRRLNPAQQIRCGSSLKFTLLAEGLADVYPRLSPVCAWDIAAGHAILRAAGGDVRTPAGAPLRYGRDVLRIPAFVASADADRLYIL